MPPLTRSPQQETPGAAGKAGERKNPSLIPTAGVGPRLKAFVIGMTLVTVIAFGVFTAMLIKSVLKPSSQNTAWGPQLLIVADRLYADGLYSQAQVQYERYLDTEDIDPATRSRVAMRVAAIYLEADNCPEALAWLYLSEAADPKSPEKDIRAQHIKHCKKRLKHRAQP